MFIAAKMEEVYSPRVADFAKSTDNGYNANQIVKMEKIILRELGWRTTPPTYAMWANWYMNQWDIYISTNESAFTHHIIKANSELTFKSSNEISYARFREVMQIIDLIVLDYNWLQYKPRGIPYSTLSSLILSSSLWIWENLGLWKFCLTKILCKKLYFRTYYKLDYPIFIVFLS